MNNLPANFYTMNTGVDGHTQACEDQDEGLPCNCRELDGAEIEKEWLDEDKRSHETIDIGNLDEIDVVDVKMPSKRFSDPFNGNPR